MTIHSETATKRQDDFQAPPLTPELKKQMHDRMVASRVTDEITIRMNRARQAIITKELIEIISGADAI